MKTIRLFLIFCLLPFITNAQDWDWISTWGSIEQDFASRGMAFDDDYVYVSGAFGGAMLTSSDTLISNGSRDALLTKLDKTTGEIIWQRQIGGPSNDGGDAIAIDDAGYIYHFGFFTSVMEVDGTTYLGLGGYDIFMAKYDTAGNRLWVKHYGGTGNELIGHIEFTEEKDFVFSGSFSESINLGGIQLTSNGKIDAMVGKIDTAGNFKWVSSIGGPEDDRFFQAFPGPNGSLYANGDMKDTFTVGNDILESAGFIDAMVGKWDANGNVLWVRRGGGINTDQPVGGTVDDNGNFYVAGYFAQSAMFGNIPFNYEDNQEGFILKYDENGTEQWGRTLNGPGGSYFYGIDYVNDDAIFVSGKIEDSTFWRDNTWNNANDNDIFLAKITSEGELLWGAVMGGPEIDVAWRVKWEDDYVYIQGWFEDTCRVGSHIGVSNGKYDGYVARRHFPFYATDINENEFSQLSFNVYPNPNQGKFTFDTDLTLQKAGQLTLINLNGQQIKNWTIQPTQPFPMQLNIPNLSKGMYFLNLTVNQRQSFSQKIIINR